MRDKGGKLWSRIRKKTIVEFERAGIVRCELCGGEPRSDFERQVLSLSHSKKRRHIENEEEMAEVCLLCIRCHRWVEYSMDSDERLAIHRELIGKRGK